MQASLAGSGQDSERASLDNDVQQIHVLAKVWGKPLALAMGFLTMLTSLCYRSLGVGEKEDTIEKQSYQKMQYNASSSASSRAHYYDQKSPNSD